MKVPYFEPWITKEDKKSVMTALSQRWLTAGPNLKKFESKISKFLGTKYACGVGSATHALHLTVKALGIGPNDQVIIPTFTFVATANSVAYCGAEPVFADVDLNTFNIMPEQIKKKITPKTKAVIAVHYGGQSCDMDTIKAITKKNKLFLIEDCAHALGSIYKNRKCGNIGISGCFSFYPTKIITTGEGGMVSTNNFKLSKKIRMLRSQGVDIPAEKREKSAKWKYDVLDLGYNYRLDEIRASLGLSQASRISEINKLRKKIASKYDNLLKNVPGISIPAVKQNRNHIYHLYTIKIEKNYHLTRDQLFLKLHKNGIGTSVQYYPLHLMSYYRNQNKKNDFPNATKLKDQVLCLPIFPKMTTKQVEFVGSIIK